MSYKDIINRANDKVMAMADLMEDELYKKIPKDKISYYIDESIKIGQEVAKEIKTKYSDKTIREVFSEEKVKIELDKSEYDFQTIKLKGKYDPINSKIIVYHKSINKMVSSYKTLGADFLDYDLVYRILLVHELYHHIEEERIGATYNRLEFVNSFKRLPINKPFPVKKTSDIAANIFTKEILNLSFHPKILNYLYMWGTSYTDEKTLSDYLDKIEAMLNN